MILTLIILIALSVFFNLIIWLFGCSYKIWYIVNKFKIYLKINHDLSIYSINLGLIILLMLPAMTFWSFFQQSVLGRTLPKEWKYTYIERTIISDSISNYATMLSLANQDKFVERYYDWCYSWETTSPPQKGVVSHKLITRRRLPPPS